MSFYKLVTIGVIFFLFVVGFLGVYLNNTFLKFGIPIEFIFIGISIIWMYVKMVDSKNKILGVIIGLVFCILGVSSIAGFILHPVVFSKDLISSSNDLFTLNLSVPQDMDACYTGCSITFNFSKVDFGRQKEGADVLISGGDINIDKSLFLSYMDAKSRAPWDSQRSYFDISENVIDTSFVAKKGGHYTVKVKVPAQGVTVFLTK